MEFTKKFHRFFKPKVRIGRVDYLKRLLSMFAIYLPVSITTKVISAWDTYGPLDAVITLLFICTSVWVFYCHIYLILSRAADIVDNHKQRKWMIFVLVWLLFVATGALGHIFLLFAPTNLLAPKLVDCGETVDSPNLHEGFVSGSD